MRENLERRLQKLLHMAVIFFGGKGKMLIKRQLRPRFGEQGHISLQTIEDSKLQLVPD